MKKFISSLKRRLINGVKNGISEYVKTVSEDDPHFTLYIWGFLKNVGKGLWNGVKGAIGGFFGKGGKVVVAGAPPEPIIIAQPKTTEDVKKPNILLYAGIAVGVIIFIIVIMMVMKKR